MDKSLLFNDIEKQQTLYHGLACATTYGFISVEDEEISGKPPFDLKEVKRRPDPYGFSKL